MDGLFEGGTPVEEIATGGECWAFVGTIGDDLEACVKEHFQAGEYLRGVLLDAAGSVAVEAVCDLVERACSGEDSSSRFSPGYCMWQLGSQSRLFDLLRPEEIGIGLLPSMLMRPLKSVSGLVVKADREDLVVPAEVCEQCDATGCARRGAIG
jgi:cobalamin-dependent methionine synthase I